VLLTQLLANPKNTYENYRESASDVIKRMSAAHDIAREVLNDAVVSAKRYFNKKVKLRSFSPGNRVLIYSVRRRSNVCPK
jgi:hypothetical protein